MTGGPAIHQHGDDAVGRSAKAFTVPTTGMVRSRVRVGTSLTCTPPAPSATATQVSPMPNGRSDLSSGTLQSCGSGPNAPVTTARPASGITARAASPTTSATDAVPPRSGTIYSVPCSAR